ncbi:MAG: AbrB/MazE/SpoVT family DNA-binding domain-containing protein [Anaerolineales bacterium]|nr:AbrB/MazE/SpoVT family DNA-binding domain-containing protein [Anaerolineales bacterium]
MSETRPFYKTRLRGRGQMTLPPEIRDRLQVREGDDVMFYVTDKGQIVVEPVRIIDPEQAWFWSERWQKMEREAQEDIDAGRVHRYATIDGAIDALEKRANARN